MKIPTKSGDPTEGSKYRKIFILVLWCEIVQYVDPTPVKEGEFPFYSMIEIDSKQRVCAASLINGGRCITACHCLAKEEWPYGPPPDIFLYNPKRITVYAGYAGGTDYRASRSGMALRVHPKCQVNESGFFYDYGVVDFVTPFSVRPKLIEWLSFPGLDEHSTEVITKIIEEPDKHECVSLDFDVVPYDQGTLQLGRTNKVEITMSNGTHCSDFWNKHKRMYDPNLHVCAYRRGKDQPLKCWKLESCPLDPGSMLMCSSGPKIDGKAMIPIGMTTGRDAPYIGSNVPEVYSRLDSGWKFLTEPIKGGDGVKFDNDTDDSTRPMITDEMETLEPYSSSRIHLSSYRIVSLCPFILFILQLN
uniref:Transmembrane protease serine 11E n=1 Tax=Lygus hesperus TaxID=30085 RepID=A0A0A9XSB0_LYGHE